MPLSPGWDRRLHKPASKIPGTSPFPHEVVRVVEGQEYQALADAQASSFARLNVFAEKLDNVFSRGSREKDLSDSLCLQLGNVFLRDNPT